MEESEEMQEGQVMEGGAPSTQADRIAELETQLEQVRQEAAENWNKYLRERAEMDNFRKRQERIATDRLQREKKELFQKILGVMDNVERALAYQDTMDRQGLQQALRMVMRQMRSEEHTSELQSLAYLVCRLLLEKKKTKPINDYSR